MPTPPSRQDRMIALLGRLLEGRSLVAWLFEPHPPMPDLQLSPAEFRDIAAYVMSLRTE